MLNSRLLYCSIKRNIGFKFNRTYLSQEYKNLIEQPEQVTQDENKLKRNFIQGDDFLAYEIEMLKPLHKNDDRCEEVYEQLLKLRASKKSTSVPETFNHIVIKSLLSASSEDLLSILSHKMEYGIFVDNFLGCYLMDFFLENKNFFGAAQIAAELMLQEDVDNELTQALSFISCYEYIKSSLNNVQTKDNEKAAEDKSEKPAKVRVKFIRNPPEYKLIDTSNLTSDLVGRTLLEFSKKCSRHDLKLNGELLANILMNDLKQLTELLKTSDNIYCKDILELSLKLLQTNESPDSNLLNNVKTSLENLLSTSNSIKYDDIVKAFITESASKNQNLLIKQQKDCYKKWEEERLKRLEIIERNQMRNVHQVDIEKTIADIQEKKQQLWFFESEEKLDLEMFRKKVYYPKRWFGKKKKPKSVDDSYIPPEIRVK